MDVNVKPAKETITIGYASSDAGSISPEVAVGKLSTEPDLPPFCYDGSHLPWRAFRQQVLGPHRIRILESPPKEKIPANLVSMIEADMPNAVKYDELERAFREQVEMGRGFGPSPIFPPNLLPPLDDEPRLARCMIPCFSRDALPERALNQMGPFYELQVPRSGLGCGFSASALSVEEISVLPPWLVTTGTIVHFDTGYISPGAALYCPFLIFERAYGEKEQRFEAANNQSAVGGACCVRALQMLYSRAWKGQLMPELPVAFSCVIDNTFAVLNIHWIDHGQAYCMSPLCKFDMSKDDHFRSFLVWVDAIGKWAVAHLLPLIKTALGRLRSKETHAAPPTPPTTARLNLSLDTGGITPNDMLIKSLKTTFDNIPWRFEDDEFTPVSSSTASWGSPMSTDIGFSNVIYPALNLVPRTPTVCQTPISASAMQLRRQDPNTGPQQQHPGRAQVQAQAQAQPQPQGQDDHRTPPPAYTQNPELVWQKRFSHAMDEVRDLQRQLAVLKNDFPTLDEMRDLRSQVQSLKTDMTASTVSVQTELSGIKTTMASVLRKENLNLRNRSLSMSIGIQETGWSIQNSNSSININSSDSDRIPPSPRSPLIHEMRPRPTSLSETGHTSTCLTEKTCSCSTEKIVPAAAAATVTSPSSPRFLSSSALLSPGPLPLSPGMLSPTFSITSETNMDMVLIPPAPPKSASLWRFAGLMVSGHMLGMFIPNLLLRVFVLGCVTDVCMLAFVSPHYPSSAEYLLSLWRAR